MGARNHAKRRHLGRQVIEVVEHADGEGTTAVVPENLRAVGLPVRVQTDTGRARLGAVVPVAEKDDLVAEDLAQKINGRRMGDEIGHSPPFKLDLGLAALVRTVVARRGLPDFSLGLEAGDVLGAEQVGNDQIAFELDVADALAQREGGPVAVVDGGLLHGRLSSVEIIYPYTAALLPPVPCVNCRSAPLRPFPRSRKSRLAAS